MNGLDALRESLREHAIAGIAKRSGVSRPAIVDIRDGKTRNPGIHTVQKITEALEALKKPASRKNGKGKRG